MCAHSTPRLIVSGSIQDASNGHYNATIPLKRFLALRGYRASPVQPSADIVSRAPCGLSLAKDIEEICDLVGIACTRFCREAVGDPRFYHDLKFCGRRPGQDTRIRVLSHINKLAIEHSKRSRAKAAMADLAGVR